MATAQEGDDKQDQAVSDLRAARGSHIIRDRADRAKAVLEPYRRCQGTDIESAIRNFLIDFFHLTQEHEGSAMEAGTLKVLVDEAAELYSLEKGVGASGIGAAFEVSYIEVPAREGSMKTESEST